MYKRIGTNLVACVSVLVFAVLAVLAFAAFAAFAQANNQGDKLGDANQLIRGVVANELKAQQQDQSRWQYRETKQQGDKTQLLEIVETKQGNLQRVVAVDGRPLAPQLVRNEDARIQHLLHNPQALQNQLRKEERDIASERRLLGMLPDAFRYQDAAKEGALVKLDFTPNPTFHPSRREAQVFHHMEGSIWLDPVHKRLARISGHLTSEVKFGGGILGHLGKGGTFLVEQQEVGGGYWELTQLDVNMNGRALFFKTIDVKQKVQNFDFKLVPSGATLLEAAQMLKRESTAPAKSRGTSRKALRLAWN